MLLQVVAVKDNAVNAFTQSVVLVPHVGASIREFIAAINDKDSSFGKHPQDYDLYHLGTFDNENGSFKNFDDPIRLSRGADVKAQPLN